MEHELEGVDHIVRIINNGNGTSIVKKSEIFYCSEKIDSVMDFTKKSCVDIASGAIEKYFVGGAKLELLMAQKDSPLKHMFSIFEHQISEGDSISKDCHVDVFAIRIEKECLRAIIKFLEPDNSKHDIASEVVLNKISMEVFDFIRRIKVSIKYEDLYEREFCFLFENSKPINNIV